MNTPYIELRFTKQQIRILKNIRRKRKIPVEQIEKHKFEKYRFLYKYALIDYSDASHKYYSLSDKGNMILLYRKESRYRFYLPLFLSVIAIIISIIALLKQ